MDAEKHETVQRDTQPEKNEEDVQTKERVYTKEDLERKMRGPGKKLKELQATVESLLAEKKEREQKEMEEQGKWKELADGYKVQIGEYENKLKSLEEKESARINKVKAEIKDRVNNLPKKLLPLIPKGLNPDAELSHILNLSSIVKDQVIQIHGSAGGRGGPISAEDEERQKLENLQNRFFGVGKKK